MVDLKLYVLTFNCGRALVEPEVFGQHLFDGWQNPDASSSGLPDVIVLNLQEIAPLGYAFLGNNLVKPYFDRFRKSVKVATSRSAGRQTENTTEYVNVLSRNAGLTAIMLFVREDVADEVGTINVSDVGVGLSEMGNKGAVGARVGWRVSKSTPLMYMTFVSAHLAPFEQEIERRDQDFLNIVSGLVFSKDDAREWRKGQQTAEDVPLLAGDAESSQLDASRPTGIYSSDSHLIFAGDLNYRTALTSPAKDDSKEFPQPRRNTGDARHYVHLLEKDQLTQQLHKGRTLHGMSEQDVGFPPTYKYKIQEDKPVLADQDVDEWKWASHRWPSWCDRILFSSTHLQVGTYSALPIFRTSDHRPVALSALVPLEPVSASQFAKEAPTSLDQHHRSRRETARRKEIVVGLGAYLGLTWEGNALLIGTILVILGGIAMLRSME